MDVGRSGPSSGTEAIGRAIAAALLRPYWLPVPAAVLRILLGADPADSLLLADAQVVPEVLLESGFSFTASSVEEAVDQAIGGSHR